MNLCPYAPNCRRAELCNSPHPEADGRVCIDPVSADWVWPDLAPPREAEEERPIVPPAVDLDLLARIDAVLAEPERDKTERPEVQDGAHIEGGLF